MFDRSAQLYDLIHGIEDYAAAAAVDRAIRARAPSASTQLDVACGTGTHLADMRDFDLGRPERADRTGLFVAVARGA